MCLIRKTRFSDGPEPEPRFTKLPIRSPKEPQPDSVCTLPTARWIWPEPQVHSLPVPVNNEVDRGRSRIVCCEPMSVPRDCLRFKKRCMFFAMLKASKLSGLSRYPLVAALILLISIFIFMPFVGVLRGLPVCRKRDSFLGCVAYGRKERGETAGFKALTSGFGFDGVAQLRLVLPSRTSPIPESGMVAESTWLHLRWFHPVFQGFLLGLLAMVLHEGGHLAAAVVLGVKIKSIALRWKGLATIREAGPPGKNLLVSLAGPFTNVLLLLAWHWSPRFGLANLCFAAVNLLPINGSDGDRALNCLELMRANGSRAD
jgi:hypothetical protein